MTESDAAVRLGKIVEAVVTRVEPYGIYLRDDELEILVLIPEAAWEPTADLAAVFPIGAEVGVRLLRFVPEKGQFVGSIRRASMEKSPYLQFARSPADRRYRARVLGIYGGKAFLETLEPHALVSAQPESVPDDLQPGSLVEVTAVSVDVENCTAVFAIDGASV